MIEEWRALLYPLGFLASFFFASRFIVQWLSSERRGKSHVPPIFWKLSLLGNLALASHTFVQVQFHVCAVQMMSAVLSWRNLQLLEEKESQLGYRSILALLCGAFLFTLLAFALQGQVLYGHYDWIRTPTMPWAEGPAEKLPIAWHIMGTVGILLFASRFWMQWWQAERHQKSDLGPAFWWMSIVGATTALTYFIRLGDYVHILGHGMALIPYIRNLQLIRSYRKRSNKEPEGIFIFAGEHSGDAHGARLIEAIREENPEIKISGVAGPKMRQAGIKLFVEMEAFQVMGFSDVIKSLPRLFSLFRQVRREILQQNPKVVIFIDYPGFNLRMAKSLRRRGYTGKLVQYISPTVWAWKKGRIRHMVSTLDLLLTIYPFEAACFDKTELKVRYVGHPLLNAVEEYEYNESWFKEVGIKEKKILIGIFPGSRQGEIQHNLSFQLEAAEKLAKNDPNLQFCISLASPQLEPAIKEVISQTSLTLNRNAFLVPREYSYELMRDSRTALATSGTVTLELGFHLTPTIVCYYVSPFNAWMIQSVFRLKLAHYCIVNIILNERVFPELIHKEFTVAGIYAGARELSQETSRRQHCVDRCKNLRDLLYRPNSSACAAKAILELIS